MFCWRCGREMQGSACGSCGAASNARPEPNSEYGRRLRHMYDTYGQERVLGQDNMLARSLSDIFYDNKGLRGQMKSAIESGAGETLRQCLRSGKAEKETLQLLSAEIACHGFIEEQADEMAFYLVEMVGFARSTATVAEIPRPKKDSPAEIPHPNLWMDDLRPVEIPRPKRDEDKPLPEIPRPAPKTEPEAKPVSVLTAMEAVSLVNATNGVGYFRPNGGQYGVIAVRSDGIAYHLHAKHGAVHTVAANQITGLKSKKLVHANPDIFIPNHLIADVQRDKFTTDVTIVLHGGERFRIMFWGMAFKAHNPNVVVDAIRKCAGL